MVRKEEGREIEGRRYISKFECWGRRKGEVN